MKSKWKLNEIIFVAISGMAIAVIFFGWTFIYTLIKPLKIFGLNYLFTGMWVAGGIFIPYIIRKPGAAIYGEMAAAFFEMFITGWGMTALLWGLVQGIICEIVFMIFGYKKYNLVVAVIAGALANLGAYFLDFIFYKYAGLKSWLIINGIWSSLLSGAILGGILSVVAANSLKKAGILRKFRIANEDKH